MLAQSHPPVSPPAPNHIGLGIYIHFPWCLKKCPYCDFLSVAVRSPETSRTATRAEAQASLPHSSYADCVINELKSRVTAAYSNAEHAEPPAKRPLLQSIFFGGGTPSLWEPSELGRVIRAIRELFDVAPIISRDDALEITVECNPSSVDDAHFAALLEQGVNRVSIGVQGLNAQRLDFLGRLHDGGQALAAVKSALKVGVPRVSADLIYGIYQQSPEDAVAEVSRVAELGVHHLSAYMLTIEENTRFGAMHAQGKLPLLDDALVASSYGAVSQCMQSAGFEHYEVSNFARPGARSVHNLGYWLGRDYLGLGTGAYGTVSLPGQRIRYRNFISPERYLTAWASGADTAQPFSNLSVEREVIDAETAIDEALMLGLRLVDGVAVRELASYRGAGEFSRKRELVIEKLCALGKLKQEGNILKIPSRYWIFADQIIRELL